jgi:beta-lactamase superfamily II metal-dependent hydrolase
MKHAISLILAVLLLSLCACGSKPPHPTAAPTAAPTEPAGTILVSEGQPVEQLDDLSVYIRVSGERVDLGDLPAFVYSEGTVAAYKGSKEGNHGLNTHIFNDTDAAAYLSYLRDLESAGWIQYSNNIIGGTNLFATYTKGEESLYCYYIQAKHRTYIVRTPNQNLEAREQDNGYTAVCEPLLTQLNLKCEEYAGGMGYVIRLSDGRFLIVDGGFNEKDFYNAKLLYSVLEEQNVLPKITVAAWIITHPHGDHLGVTSDFLRIYDATQVDIQQLILNFPSDEDLGKADPDILVNDHTSYYPTFKLVLKQVRPDLKITVCHTGQRYYFADAVIEFLHTPEDFFPMSIATLSSNAVNGASTVFTLEVGGQKTMFLADCAIDESKDLVKMWGSYLKSDILQAAHHCQRGGTVELYEAIDPTVVLAPLPAKSIQNRNILSYESTRWLWNNESGHIREIILSGWLQRTLELPYTPAEGTEYFSNATTDPWAGQEAEYKKTP